MTTFVVADNCTDATGRLAWERGAEVYYRRDRQRVGKGYALDYLLRQVKQDYGDCFDGYFVFDADNLLEPDYISRMNETFSQGYQVVTSCRNSKNFGSNWISAGYALWFLRESEFLNHALMLLGTSCAVSGHRLSLQPPGAGPAGQVGPSIFSQRTSNSPPPASWRGSASATVPRRCFTTSSRWILANPGASGCAGPGGMCRCCGTTAGPAAGAVPERGLCLLRHAHEHPCRRRCCSWWGWRFTYTPPWRTCGWACLPSWPFGPWGGCCGGCMRCFWFWEP